MLLGGLRACLLELTLQICVFSPESILSLLIRALRLPNRNVVLVILNHRFRNLKVLLCDCAPKLSDLIVFILQLASQSDGKLLLSGSLCLDDLVLGSFSGRLAQLVCHLVNFLCQNLDFLLHDLAIDLEPGTFLYLAVRDGDNSLERLLIMLHLSQFEGLRCDLSSLVLHCLRQLRYVALQAFDLGAGFRLKKGHLGVKLAELLAFAFLLAPHLTDRLTLALLD